MIFPFSSLILCTLLLNWFGFYGISTIVGYLMPNPVYTCILNFVANNSVKHQSIVYTVKWSNRSISNISV